MNITAKVVSDKIEKWHGHVVIGADGRIVFVERNYMDGINIRESLITLNTLYAQLLKVKEKYKDSRIEINID